jgi:DNA polymerase-4
MRHLADRVASRLRAKSRPWPDGNSPRPLRRPSLITRSTTLDAPIASTVTLAEIAEELVRKALAHHPDEKMISLLAISVSQLSASTCSSNAAYA